MKNKKALLVVIISLLVAGLLNAHPDHLTQKESLPGVTPKVLSVSALKHLTGQNLTAVEVEIEPGITIPAHMHSGFVFVYVLEGVVRSQLNNNETKTFFTGQSWVEPPGTVHSLTQNPSKTEKVKLLAVFVAQEGAELTLPPEK